MDWQTAQQWERGWWGNCVNTYGEQMKQLLYAEKMGLQSFHDGKSPFNFDLDGKSVLDVGGGPTSLLLKCRGFTRAKVIDPLKFPDWVLMRYNAAGIEFEQVQAEHMNEKRWDECWIYNVLQHTEDPAQIVSNAHKAGRIIRVFEWLDTLTNEGHPHKLTKIKLDGWLGGEGKVEMIDGRNTCCGKAYYGIFVGTR